MKTYQITESELQALLEKQKEICADAYSFSYLHTENVSDYQAILNAPTPDLSHLKEAPQLPDLKELRERFYIECVVKNEYNPEITEHRYIKEPKDLFEWFKPYLQLPKEEEKWISVEDWRVKDG